MKRLVAHAAFAVALHCAIASAATPGVEVDGLVSHPLELTRADLVKFPPTDLDASFQTAHGLEKGHYRGVLLWSLVQKAGLSLGPGDKRTKLRHSLLVTGRDGYAVLIAIGEIDPDFEGKPVLLAYARNNQPLGSDHLRLLVPGDKHGGRAVRAVIHIEIE